MPPTDLNALAARYTPEPVPPCPVCSGDLRWSAPGMAGLRFTRCPNGHEVWGPAYSGGDPAVLAACAELARRRAQQAAQVEAFEQIVEQTLDLVRCRPDVAPQWAFQAAGVAALAQDALAAALMETP